MKVFSFVSKFTNSKQKSNDIAICGDIRLDNKDALCANLQISYDPNLADEYYIIKAYQKYGLQCVDYLIGAFAFVINDPQKDTILCVRDQMGVKPFFYFSGNNHFVASNRKNEILQQSFSINTPNWEYIIQTFLDYNRRIDDTEYEHVLKLPPAHFLLIQKNKITALKRYWELDVKKEIRYQKDEDYIEHFRELMKTAVRDRMHTPNNVATHLSGGLDSSGITGIAAHVSKELNKELHTLSYTFPEDKELMQRKEFQNENDYVREQIAFSGIQHSYLIDKPLYFNLANIVVAEAEHLDGFSATNNVATEFEMHHTSKNNNIDVVLSGFPGDELVTSFVRAHYLEYLERGSFIKYFTSKHHDKYSLKKLLVPFALHTGNKLGLSIDKHKVASKYYENYKVDKKRIDALKKMHLFNPDFLKKSPTLEKAFDPSLIPMYSYGFPTTLKEYQRNHISRRHTSSRIESENLAGHRFGIEYRYPFTDIRLLQYVLSIPVEQKINKENSRLIYRRSMESFVPDSIRFRDNKQGSIKPLSLFYKRDHNALKKLYVKLRNENHLGFLNTKLIDQILIKEQFPPYFFNYLILGQLVKLKKLDLN